MEKNEVRNDKLSKFYKNALYFFIFAFLGWVLETVYCLIVLGHFTKRGFLYGPLCPIYGWGAIILIIFLSKYKDSSLKLFTYSAIVFSIFEYFVSFMLEAMFQAHWWDYTTDFMNLNGRISIFYTLAWGFIAIIFIGHVFPFIEKKVNVLTQKFSNNTIINVTRIISIIFIADTFLSCLRYLNIFSIL